jgi:hypothetical protein
MIITFYKMSSKKQNGCNEKTDFKVCKNGTLDMLQKRLYFFKNLIYKRK